jgi:dipeptidyl aminopeptidase/acylaminoacyl peptidase
MNRWISPRLVALTVALIALTSAGAAPNEWTPERMMDLKQVGGVQVSPDGKRVVFTVRQAVMDGNKSEYLTHIHLVNVDGSDSVQLTQGDKSCDQPRWSPDSKSIAFLSARVGKRNIWLLPVQGGEAQQLTRSKTDVTSLKWAPNGKLLAFTAMDEPTPEEDKAAKSKNDARVVDENIKMSRLYVTPIEKSGPVKLLSKGPFSVGTEIRGGYDWSPDSKTIVFTQVKTPRPDDWPSADLSLVDVGTGTVKPLVQTKAAEFSPLFSPDGQSVAYVASDNPATWGGNARVHIIPATGGESRPLAETFDGFGRYSELVGWSADGKRLFCTEAHGTLLRLIALPLNGSPDVFSSGAGVFSGGVSLNATRTMFGFGWETVSGPSEAAVSPVEIVVGRTVSHVNDDFLKLPRVKTDVVHWKSPDGQAVEGLLTYPLGYEKGKRYPTLLVIHGGPAGVFTQMFAGSPGPYPVATFATRGYAVLRPNPRGSSGYGMKFRYANYGDWGGGDFKDLMAGVDHVIEQGIADPDRLGVMGWSYGGFMTSWTITQTKRFKVASVGAGVTNLMSFTGTADIPSFLPDYFGGEPWDKPEAYRTHSAMFQVKGVTTPTLIQHGERDLRVPLSQGQELYNALKRQGCTTQMVIYPRTPHGIEEPKLLLDCMNRNVQWFDKYLRSK